MFSRRSSRIQISEQELYDHQNKGSLASHITMDDWKRLKESSLPSAFGTPNDVRLFPGATTQTSSSAPTMSSTRSIPIANHERSLTEIQQDEQEAMAEYRDHAMYLRIVHGIKEKSTSGGITLHSAGLSDLSDTVAKIARTRNSKLVRDEHSGHYGFKEPQVVCDTRLGYQNVLQQVDTICWGENPEEEGIFEMDL